ncbi:hypothetical protein CHU32_14430 [Superficieibacter electus]|uniref:Uncharacterized protein n=1 Tax=Superficieibacter electus TaxID=2022662 RepID=A0A2P5GNB9_9ENTR|nr:hypothetical protein CHU33_15140 [Superficieibacter electus]POP48039.1 hypothetical protein CHU32_14430 [Superficieibacter electus]
MRVGVCRVKLFIARYLYRGKNSGFIVVLGRRALNAYFCRCLAHFSTTLEKAIKCRQTKRVILRPRR